MPCLLTPLVAPPHRIILPPGSSLYPYQHTNTASSLHGFLLSPERQPSLMTLPRLLPSLAIILSLLISHPYTLDGYPLPLILCVCQNRFLRIPQLGICRRLPPLSVATEGPSHQPCGFVLKTALYHALHPRARASLFQSV